MGGVVKAWGGEVWEERGGEVKYGRRGEGMGRRGEGMGRRGEP